MSYLKNIIIVFVLIFSFSFVDVSTAENNNCLDHGLQGFA
jgi:hypothetical protein